MYQLQLQPLDLINGLLSVCIALTGLLVGALIVRKHFQRKERDGTYLCVGLAFIGFYQPWWGSAASFLSFAVLGRGLSLPSYILVSNLAVPVCLGFYFHGIGSLVWERSRAVVTIAVVLVSGTCTALMLAILADDPANLGTLEGAFDIAYAPFMEFYLALALAPLFISGVALSLSGVRSGLGLIRWKGVLLLLSYTLYLGGGILDMTALGSSTVVSLLLTRSLLALGAGLFYLGFFLPRTLYRWVSEKAAGLLGKADAPQSPR